MKKTYAWMTGAGALVVMGLGAAAAATVGPALLDWYLGQW